MKYYVLWEALKRRVKCKYVSAQIKSCRWSLTARVVTGIVEPIDKVPACRRRRRKALSARMKTWPGEALIVMQKKAVCVAHQWPAACESLGVTKPDSNEKVTSKAVHSITEEILSGEYYEGARTSERAAAFKASQVMQSHQYYKPQ